MRIKLKFILTFCFIFYFQLYAYAYNGITHGAITNTIEVENENIGIIHNYLKMAGFPKGRYTTFTLNLGKYWSGTGLHIFTSLTEARGPLRDYYTEARNPYNFDNYNLTATYTALDWLIIGSILEDIPLLSGRAQNHFHDPTTFLGLTDYYYMRGTSAGFRLQS